MNDLEQIYKMKLRKMLNVEEQIIAALPAMIANATDEDLQEGLDQHLQETEEQRDRLMDILARHGEAGAEEDVAFKALLAESEKAMRMITDAATRDAAIIADAQVVEHIEIARYGTLIAWAKAVGDDDSVSALEETLSEEENADKKLTSVAESGLLTTGVNEEAV